MVHAGVTKHERAVAARVSAREATVAFAVLRYVEGGKTAWQNYQVDKLHVWIGVTGSPFDNE